MGPTAARPRASQDAGITGLRSRVRIDAGAAAAAAAGESNAAVAAVSAETAAAAGAIDAGEPAGPAVAADRGVRREVDVAHLDAGELTDEERAAETGAAAAAGVAIAAVTAAGERVGDRQVLDGDVDADRTGRRQSPPKAATNRPRN